jgi:RNA polymerase sigma-70 factor (ECF subfamily)
MNARRDIEDALLLLRARNGDADAFADFVIRWQDRLRGHAERLTGQRAAADDVLQETWIAVLKGLWRLSDLGAYRAWIYRILSRKAADWVRRNQRQRRLDRHAAREAVVTSGGEQRSDRIESLDDAVKRLSPPLRDVVLLHYVEGFSVEEVAGVLRIPRGTVKSRLHNARKQLRALIEEQNHAEAERRSAGEGP